MRDEKSMSGHYHTTHCNTKAYSTSFVAWLKTKTKKPDGDCPSPFILISHLSGRSAQRQIPWRVNCKKDNRWLLTTEAYFNNIFHIFCLGFFYAISESQVNTSSYFSSIYCYFKCHFESSSYIHNEIVWQKVSGHGIVLFSFIQNRSQNLQE